MKVLLRRKFFTAISLFGISFTLVVLMLATAALDHVLAPYPPEINQDRTLGIYYAQERGEHGAAQRSARLPAPRPLRPQPARRRADVDLQHPAASTPIWAAARSSRRSSAPTPILADPGIRVSRRRALHQRGRRGGPLVAVINETTRRRFFGGEPAWAGPSRRTASASAWWAWYRTCRPAAIPSPTSGCHHTTAKSDSWRRSYAATSWAPPARSPALLASGARSLVAPAGGRSPRRDVHQDRRDPGNAVRHARAHVLRRPHRAAPDPALAAGGRAGRRRHPVHAAAHGEPGEPDGEPHHGARLRDRRPQSLRRLDAVLVGQFVVENVVLTLVGAAIGFVIAAGCCT